MSWSRITHASWLLLLGASRMDGQWQEGPVQIHGFFSQGFAISDHNNYLTMQTSRGTAKMTDGGMNLTWQIKDNLRVGVQAYDRYIGDLGKGKVTLDWALIDYRLRDWIGFRAGKVKTPIGLFNDSQDQEFLYTWALLPQSVYPLDLREMTSAHTGFDIYGTIDLRKRGFLTYQAYAGQLPSNYRTGFLYGIEDSGFRNVTYSARTTGYDLRWVSPVSGLMAGISQSFTQREFDGELVQAPIRGSAKTYFSRRTNVYAEYARGPWRLDAEYRAYKSLTYVDILPPGYNLTGQNGPGWYTAVSYRFSRRLEAGAYRSQYRFQPLFNTLGLRTDSSANHIYDTTVTFRVDLSRYWDVKVEGHLIDGVGSPVSARGFYPRYHPDGLQPRTNMLVLRTGFRF